MDLYPLLDQLRSAVKDREVAEKVQYIIRRSTKHFGDDGM